MLRWICDHSFSYVLSDLVFGDGLTNVDVFVGPNGDVSAGVEVYGSLGENSSFLFFKLVLSELDRCKSTTS